VAVTEVKKICKSACRSRKKEISTNKVKWKEAKKKLLYAKGIFIFKWKARKK